MKVYLSENQIHLDILDVQSFCTSSEKLKVHLCCIFRKVKRKRVSKVVKTKKISKMKCVPTKVILKSHAVQGHQYESYYL